ncbi:MAG: spheroidene monooxygenase [Pseudomonadota bacterium]
MARIWAFAMMGLARPAMARVDGIGFWKLCGSGTGEGFTPLPNTGVYAILATWPDLETAQHRIAQSGVYKRYRARAVEDWTVYLAPTSVRGQWSGVTPFEAESQHASGPVAALTRATIKPSAALRFWKRVPDISTVIGLDNNVVFKIGIGEMPLLHQVTFSIWPDTTTMADFARADGPHARAIKAVRAGDWFQEELYARFQVTACDGTWNGHPPLQSIGLH